MPPMDVVVPGLQALIAFQCLLFSAYLFAGRRLGVLANRINLALLLVLAAHMLLNLLSPHVPAGSLGPLMLGAGLLYGPLILLYLNSLVFRGYRWRALHWLHLLPAVLLGSWVAMRPMPALLAAGATFASLGIYLSLSIRLLHRFRRVLADTQSALGLMAMDWAWTLLRLSGLILLVNMASVALQSGLGRGALAQVSEIALFLVLLLLASSFILKGLLQPELFAGITEEDQRISEQRMRGTGAGELSQARQSDIQQALLAYMQSHKPYLNPLLSLATLGRQLGETPRYVSQVINARLHMNFSDFINGYRIEEAKQRLADPSSERTVLDILQDCGFSTKSNFNRAFRQHVGTTPSAFRKRALDAAAAGKDLK